MMCVINCRTFSILFLLAFVAINVQADCPTDTDDVKWYQIPTITKTCFHFEFSTTRRYSEAIKYCEQFTADDASKAYLIEPSTSALQQAISSYASLLGKGKSMLTGGNDISSEGDWRWNNNPSKYLCTKLIPYIFLPIYI